MGLEDHLFNLKLTAKQLERDHRKFLKDEAKERINVKKAIEKGDAATARIYAQNAIRHKTQALNFLRLSGRVDAVASRVQAAVRMNGVTKEMKTVVKGMDAAMKSMKLDAVAKIMDQFERQFDTLDAQSEVVEGAMGRGVAATMPEDEVDGLIMSVGAEHSIDVRAKLPDVASNVPDAEPEAAAGEDEDLEARLARLRS